MVRVRRFGDTVLNWKIQTAQRVIGHTGGDFGISSAVRWFPDSGNYTFVVLSNYDRGGILTDAKLQEIIVQNGE